MFRMFTTAAALTLAMTAAQAGDLSTSVHQAAVAACAPESVLNAGAARSYYAAITEHCIDRLSNAAMAKYQAEAEAKASRPRLANN